MLHFGIIGAQGVGKTTLANKIKEVFKIPLIQEQMRDSVNAFSLFGFDSLEQIIDSSWYTHFVVDLIKRQLEQEEQHVGHFISDRTVLDYYLYYETLSNDSTTLKDMIKNFAIEHFKRRYDMIIYIPIMFPLKTDGFRNVDIDFQRDMDWKFQKVLQYAKKVYVIEGYNLEDRLNELRESLCW